MTFQDAIWLDRLTFRSLFHTAIVYGLTETWERCVRLGNKPYEPDFVAGLVVETTPLIFSVLRTIFEKRGFQISVAASFCHQTPKVSFQRMKKSSCELGDILWVHSHTSVGGHTTRNALLLQAKVSSSQPYRIPSSECDQLRLYEEWPSFRYVNSPGLNGLSREVLPKSPHLGAQYLLIDDRPPNHPLSGLRFVEGTYPVGVCMPSTTLHDHADFGSELLSLLLLQSGRCFSDKSTAEKTQDGWSQLVWDLLESGLQRAFNRKRSGYFSKPRHSGSSSADLDGFIFSRSTQGGFYNTAYQVLGQQNASFLFDYDNEFSNRPRQNNDGPTSDDGSGISLVLIETSDAEQRPED